MGQLYADIYQTFECSVCKLVASWCFHETKPSEQNVLRAETNEMLVECEKNSVQDNVRKKERDQDVSAESQLFLLSESHTTQAALERHFRRGSKPDQNNTP